MSDRDIDRQLVERAQRGDKRAFELLVEKYQRKLGRLLSRFIRDPAEVEDVTQEAFIKAYRALPAFRGDSAFYTWLYRIGINTAKNYLMAMGRRAPTSTEVEAEEAEGFEEGEQLRDINTPESVLLSNEIAQTVNATIEGLPEELRKAIQMREIDRQLVARAQRGDKRAFELLVEKYQRKLARLLSRFIRDPAEVEDVTQEAFIKAYRALPAFRGDSAFYTWLYRIGINTAKNYLMAMGRRAPTSTEVEADEAEGFEEGEQLRDINTPESVLLSNEIAETVNSTIEKLPEELRTAIQLREIEGMSYEEIAKVMDCPIGTVRSRIFRAREAIAEQLRPLLGTRKDQRW